MSTGYMSREDKLQAIVTCVARINEIEQAVQHLGDTGRYQFRARTYLFNEMNALDRQIDRLLVEIETEGVVP